MQSVGIETVHDLPGVGENLQDHIGGRMIYRCIDGTVTMNEIYHNWLRRIYAGAEWILARKGPLMTGAGPMGLFVKTRPELASPDVQYQFLAGSARDAPAIRCTASPPARWWRSPAGRRAAAGCASPAPIPTRPPAMQPNYLSTQRDKETIVAGLRVIRNIFATEAMRHWVTTEYLPGPQATTDEDLLEHVRATAGTTFHQTSTCMMGPGPMAVVDTELRVKGTPGPACDRCFHHADRGVGQHQRHGHHDRREGRRHDPEPGRRAAGRLIVRRTAFPTASPAGHRPASHYLRKGLLWPLPTAEADRYSVWYRRN